MITLARERKFLSVMLMVALIFALCVSQLPAISNAFVGIGWAIGLGGASAAAFGVAGAFWASVAGVVSFGIGFGVAL